MSRQLFNVTYFLSATAAATLLSQAYLFTPILVAATLFGLLTVCACCALFSRTTYLLMPDVKLNPSWQFWLRQLALLIPIPFLVLSAASAVADNRCEVAQEQLRHNEDQAAIANLQQAVFLNPRFSKAYTCLATAYSFTRDYEKSLANADKAISIDPNDSKAYGDKAFVLDKLNRDDEALQAALTAAKINPMDGQAQHAVAVVYKHMGALQKALAAADLHIECHRYEPDAFDLRAEILEQLNQPAEAEFDRYTANDLRFLSTYKPPSQY